MNGDNSAELDELGKLLADVQRTIKENKLFIHNLKEEATEADETEDVESDNRTTSEEDRFEEL